MAVRLGIYLLLVVGSTCHHCSPEPILGNGNNQTFNYNFCSEKSGDGLGFIILDDTTGYTRWPRDALCMAIPDTPTFRGLEYVVTFQFLNYVGRSDSANDGHPGLVYNLVDSANYDFLIFRPHWTEWCYAYGYLANGNMVYDIRKTGRCPHGAPRGRMWHDVRLHVVGRETRVFLNNDRLATIPHNFPNVARGGPAIKNGFENRVYFRGFTIKPHC